RQGLGELSCVELLNEKLLLRRDLRGHLLINVQVRLQHFAGDAPEPLVQRNIHELVRCKQLQDHQVGITRVFEVVRCVGGNIPDIVGTKIHCAGIIDSKEYDHATVAGDIVV